MLLPPLFYPVTPSLTYRYTPYYRWVDNVLESALLVHLALEFLVSILIGESALTGNTQQYDSLQSFLDALNWIGYAVVGIVVLLHIGLYFIKDDAARVQRFGDKVSSTFCLCFPPLPLQVKARLWALVNLSNYVQAGSDAYAIGDIHSHHDQEPKVTSATLSRGFSAPYASVLMTSPTYAAYPLASPQWGGRVKSADEEVKEDNGRPHPAEMEMAHSDQELRDHLAHQHHRAPPPPPTSQ